MPGPARRRRELVLFCCWTASRQQRLDRRTLARAMRLVGAWQADVVRPLRAARRALARALPAVELVMGEAAAASIDPAREALKRGVTEIELEAEYVEQTLLAQYAESLPAAARPLPAPLAARASLVRYLALLGVAEGAAQAEVDALVSVFEQ
ncbi:MAG: DUF2390 domain-containing protein [Rubrivivax sp.]